MQEKPPRRRRDFRDFDAVLREVDTLSAGGYEQAGNWNLAQVCGHLSEWLRFPLDGFPRPPVLVRVMFWFTRPLARLMLRRILENRSMQSGGRTIDATIPPPDGDQATAVEQFRRAVARFRTHAGPFHRSPLFGAWDPDQWTQLQLIHCSHHLSFLVPKRGSEAE